MSVMGEPANQPVKVLHVISRMNVGGPAVEIAELMNHMDSTRVTQRLVTGWCDETELDFLESLAERMPVTRVNGLGRDGTYRDNAKAFHQLVQMIRITRPDVVHTHTAKAGLLGRLAARVAGTKPRIVHTYHGHLLYGYFGRFRTGALIRLEQKLARITDDIIVVSDRVREDLLNARIGSRNQYFLVHSGISQGSLPLRSTARKDLEIPDGALVVTLLGRLVGIKRPDRFIETVKHVTASNPDIVFLVAGGGALEAQLRSDVSRWGLPVKVLGWRLDVETILAATDIMLLTSDNEGIPISLIQAGMAGIPSVATNVGGVCEVVRDAVTGLLTHCDPESLSEAILCLARNPDQRRQFGQQAARYTREEFNSQKFIEQHQAIYERAHK